MITTVSFLTVSRTMGVSTLIDLTDLTQDKSVLVLQRSGKVHEVQRFDQLRYQFLVIVDCNRWVKRCQMTLMNAIGIFIPCYNSVPFQVNRQWRNPTVLICSLLAEHRITGNMF